MSNSLMLESAMARLRYWESELKAAEAAGKIEHAHQCAKFIREYGVLIEEMTDAMKAEGQQKG